MAASVAQPVAQRALKVEEQGAVVVLIDTSRSMSVQDTQRTPANKVALADGKVRSFIDGHEVVKVIVVPQRLVNVVVK